MFGSCESTFYRWTATFYGMKLSRCVKKLLSSEGRPSDNFSIEIYRGNLVKIWCFWSIFFSFLTLDAQKLIHIIESDESWQNLVILSVKIQKFEFFPKTVKFWSFFKNTCFSQNHVGTYYFFKDEARKLKFGAIVTLYGI